MSIIHAMLTVRRYAYEARCIITRYKLTESQACELAEYLAPATQGESPESLLDKMKAGNYWALGAPLQVRA